MGCFNPDNVAFVKTVNSKIYIDKTGLLNCMNEMILTETNCIALSHARRFGKSQAARMIDAYYSKGSDSRELFSRFEIAKSPDFEKHLNKYNVIHLDITSYTDLLREKNLIDRIMGDLYVELKEEYPDIPDKSNTVGRILNYVYQKSAAPFVIIIDEWDCVVREYSDKPDMVHEYLQFLHSLFKSEESKHFLALGYITGILPIKKIKNESALNNFREYTMISSKRLTKYFGFTEDEVKTLCAKYNMDFDTIKAWYNGYLIDGSHMYNPNSVSRAMDEGYIESYWTNTSSFETINDLILLNYDGLKDDIIKILGGEELPVDTTTFRNDLSDIASKDEALTALIHLGYLGCNAETKTAYLPNYEVGTAYQSALKSDKWGKIAPVVKQCDALLRATIAKEAAKVAEIIDNAHDAFTSVLKYNDENSLSCVVTMAYFTAPQYYTIVREFPSGKGFADLAFIPLPRNGKPPMIIELKYDKTADTAIRQIKEKRYAGALKDFGDEILLVAISYDKDSDDKKHSCVIESVKV